MSKKIKQVRRINREQLIQFTQGCLRARSIDALIRELAVIIAPACSMDVAALVIPGNDRHVKSYVGSVAPLSNDADETIRHHLSELIEEVIDIESDPAQLDLTQVDCGDAEPISAQIASTHVMWTVDLGSSDSPIGLLCLFGPDASNLDQQALIDLRMVGTLLVDAIGRIVSEVAPLLEPAVTDEAEIIMFEIGHYEAIREVFGPRQATALSEDIIERISTCLPAGSSVARVDAARTVVIIRDTTVPAGFLVEKCLAACGNIEIAEKILVSIRSAIAPTVTIADEQHRPLAPTAPLPAGIWQTLGLPDKITG